MGGQGGDYANHFGQGSPSSAEFWTSSPEEMNCLLPEIPNQLWQPSIAVVGSKALVCEKSGCLWLEKDGWQTGPATVHMRRYHTSAVTDEGVLLVGGLDSPTTTELVPLNGGESRPSFTLLRGRREHCSIQTGPNSFVLTGGHLAGTSNLVTEFTPLGVDQVETKDLPLLKHGRYQTHFFHTTTAVKFSLQVPACLWRIRHGWEQGWCLFLVTFLEIFRC